MDCEWKRYMLFTGQASDRSHAFICSLSFRPAGLEGKNCQIVDMWWQPCRFPKLSLSREIPRSTFGLASNNEVCEKQTFTMQGHWDLGVFVTVFREIHPQLLCNNWVRDQYDVDLVVSGGSCEKWLEYGCILKVASTTRFFGKLGKAKMTERILAQVEVWSCHWLRQERLQEEICTWGVCEARQDQEFSFGHARFEVTMRQVNGDTEQLSYTTILSDSSVSLHQMWEPII